MKVSMLASTPLYPLAKRARVLSRKAATLEVASGFVSELAARDILGPAIAGGATIRFLTGTFGRVTRLQTFKYLEALAAKGVANVRVLTCGTHRDLHAKLFIWRLRDGRVVVWVGSANLTSGGFVNEGELVCQIVASKKASRVFTGAFEREWRRGEDIDDTFLSKYKEAARTGHLTRRMVTPTRRATRRVPLGDVRLYVTVGTHHYKDDGSVVRRVDELLEGTASHWFRDGAKSARHIRRDDLFLLDDRIDKDLLLGRVTDVVRDRRARIIAYEPLFPRSPVQTTTKTLMKKLSRIGLRLAGKGLATQWAVKDRALASVLALRGAAAARRIVKRRASA